MLRFTITDRHIVNGTFDVTIIPEDVRYLHINSLNLTSLPSNLKVNANLVIFGCPNLAYLPNNLSVKGNIINLADCTGLLYNEHNTAILKAFSESGKRVFNPLDWKNNKNISTSESSLTSLEESRIDSNPSPTSVTQVDDMTVVQKIYATKPVPSPLWREVGNKTISPANISRRPPVMPGHVDSLKTARKSYSNTNNGRVSPLLRELLMQEAAPKNNSTKGIAFPGV